MKQTALLDGQQEDDPVNESQELLKVGHLCQRAILQCRSERHVVWVREEALAQGDYRLFDAPPQVLTRARSLFATCDAPRFERSFRRSLARFAESGLVR